MPYITQMELRGFKSFGNKKVVIPLSKGLTAIIGKNGAGKSNIVDAFCFVFGERSKKLMRTTQLTDFIYSKKGRFLAPFAEVSVIIDNSDSAIPMDSQTVKITRRVDRSGRSTFKINDERADLQTIVDLLTPVIGGPESFNFVLQGQVGKIVEMNPVERREIIDNLAGISEYDAKRRAAEAELMEATKNLEVLHARVEEIQRTRDSLKSQVKAMLRYKALETELQQVKGAVLKKETDVLEKKVRKLKREIKQGKRKSSKFDKKKKEHESRARRYEKSAAQIQEKIEKIKNSKIMEKITRLRSRISVLEGMVKESEREKNKISEKIDALKKTVPLENSRFPAIQKFEETKKSILDLIEKIESASTLEEAKSLGGRLKSAFSELEHLFEAVVSALSEGASITSDIYDLAEISRLTTEMRSYDLTIARCKDDLEKTRARLEKLLPEESKLIQKMKKLEERKISLEGKAKHWKRCAENLSSNLQTLAGALAGKIPELRAYEQKLEQQKRELENIPGGYEGFARQKIEDLRKREEALEKEIKQIGNVNFRAQEDLIKKEEELAEEKMKEEKLLAEKEKIQGYMREIDERKKEVFMTTFEPAARNFSELFAEITGTGSGRLILENELSPFDGGVIIDADFGEGERKGLSGGQKTVAGLAFLFALQKYRPTTLYILDEIDAHLDASYRRKVAELLRKLSRESQMVIVTLHHSMAAAAESVFGVTKENGVSNAYSIRLSKMGD